MVELGLTMSFTQYIYIYISNGIAHRRRYPSGLILYENRLVYASIALFFHPAASSRNDGIFGTHRSVNNNTIALVGLRVTIRHSGQGADCRNTSRTISRMSARCGELPQMCPSSHYSLSKRNDQLEHQRLRPGSD